MGVTHVVERPFSCHGVYTRTGGPLNEVVLDARETAAPFLTDTRGASLAYPILHGPLRETVTDAVMPPVPAIQHTDVDGVPTRWIDEPGPMVASLVFRVGRSDEPTPFGGISHIVEHLTLARLGIQDYDHNGFVDGHMTVFTSMGRPDEIAAFMTSVADSMADLPLDRLLLERRILREERDQRGPSIGGALRWYRFGYAGQGRGLGPADDELALEWLGPDHVDAWRARWFTRQNAVLWLTGAPPAGLRLTSLADGPRPTIPTIEPVPGVAFPAHLPWDGPGATLSMLAPRTSAINIAGNIAHRRARQRLRFDEGLVYDIQFDYEPVTPTIAHLSLGADCPEERVPTVLDGLLATVRELGRDGPSTAELGQEMNAYLRQFEDRDGRIGLLAMTAFDALWGAPTHTAEEFAQQRRAVDGEQARAAMADALPSLFVLANCPPLDGMTVYPAWSTAGVVAGREFSPSGFHLPGRKPRDRLVVGPDGASFTIGPAEYLTVRYADTVACIHEAPDVRRLLARDGTQVVIAAPAWKDGARAIEAVDAAVPVDLVACDTHGRGALADPAKPQAGTAGPG